MIRLGFIKYVFNVEVNKNIVMELEQKYIMLVWQIL